MAETAKGLAAATYEEWASSSNEFYKEVRSQEQFVMLSWPKFIEAARGALAALLARPDTADGLKEEIMCALIDDEQFRAGRKRNGIGGVGKRTLTHQTQTKGTS